MKQYQSNNVEKFPIHQDQPHHLIYKDRDYRSRSTLLLFIFHSLRDFEQHFRVTGLNVFPKSWEDLTKNQQN